MILERVASIYRGIGWLSGRGNRRRVHRTPQRAGRRAVAAVASLPVYFLHGHRFEHRRAEWRDVLAIRSMTMTLAQLADEAPAICGACSPISGSGVHNERTHMPHTARSAELIELSAGSPAGYGAL
jgi:hypothetical protein